MEKSRKPCCPGELQPGQRDIVIAGPEREYSGSYVRHTGRVSTQVRSVFTDKVGKLLESTPIIPADRS